MMRSGRRRGRPTRPRTAGTASTSGISWVTSLRLPPVSVQASGIPVASTRRCFDPFLPLSTGLGPVSEPSFSLARGWSRPPRETTRFPRRHAARQAATRAAAPTPRPAATRLVGGNKSSPSQSQGTVPSFRFEFLGRSSGHNRAATIPAPQREVVVPWLCGQLRAPTP